MVSTKLFTPIGISRALAYYQTIGAGGMLLAEPITTEAAAILCEPHKGRAVLRGYCAVDSRSNAAATLALEWVTGNMRALEVLLGTPPRVDMANFVTLSTKGGALHAVDVVIRLPTGCRAVAQTASLVLALVAMAWKLECPAGISAVGGLDLSGRLFFFPQMCTHYLVQAALHDFDTLLVHKANAAHLAQAVVDEPLNNSAIHQQAKQIKVIGCETVMEMVRHAFKPAEDDDNDVNDNDQDNHQEGAQPD